LNSESNLSGLKLAGGDLPGTLELVNFHLHWGENHKSGSEHEVFMGSQKLPRSGF
ncbi:unnamed protein product, partial [Rotaria sordida]